MTFIFADGYVPLFSILIHALRVSQILEILNSKLFQHIVKIAISQSRVRRLINFLAKEKKKKKERNRKRSKYTRHSFLCDHLFTAKKSKFSSYRRSNSKHLSKCAGDVIIEVPLKKVIIIVFFHGSDIISSYITYDGINAILDND